MHTVVIGGGVVGLSCALALAERGGDVTVCEAGTLGGGSTGRAAGGIRAQFSTPVNVDLSLASVPVWESFEERFGVDVDYRKNGYLFLAREEETAAAFEANVEMQTARGVDSRTLSPAEAREHCPQLRAEAFVAATYCPDDGVADPHSAVQGYSRAVEKRGVDVRTKTPVTGLSAPGSADGPWRVETPGETLSADYVVNAAGAWARRVGRLAGVELPIAPRRRQATVVEPETAVAESVPLTVDLDRGVYFRPEREGTALVGGHFADADPDVDPDDFSESPDLAWTAEAVERAADAAAYFGPETRVRNGWAGLYAVTPDHHAVVDEVRPGFVVAAGFSGHGFQHAPATGECVAELCVDGAASHADISALSLERFESDEEGMVEKNVA